jgi:dTDP-4-dehydrorhamnose reductase
MKNPVKKRLLITGASGFLGWNICAVAQNTWHTIGITNTHRVIIPGTVSVMVDLTNYHELKKILHDITPDAVIHAAAASQPNFCQEHPQESSRINVEATVNLAAWCSEKNIPFVFTSSDLVFDGTSPPYGEKTPVSPVNIYGQQKVKAEESVMKLYPPAAICRMPLMYGDPSPYSGSFIMSIVKNLRNNKAMTLFCDEYRSPVSAASAACGLLMALEKAHGIVHLGGRERVSRYEFGLKVAEYLHKDTSLIQPVSQNSVIMAAPRPRDVSLNSSLAYSLGYSPLLLDEALKQIDMAGV